MPITSGALKDDGGFFHHTGGSNGAEQGGGVPVTVRSRKEAALTQRRTPIETRHVGFRSGFIEENQRIDIHETPRDAEVQTLPRNLRPILLGRTKRFF